MEKLKTQIASLKKGIASKVIPAEMKKRMESQLVEVEKQLAELESKPAVKVEEKKIEKVEEKKAEVKKEPATKTKTLVSVDGKSKMKIKVPAKSTIKEEGDVTCEELLAQLQTRKKNHDKANKAYATTSISEKIGNNLASAVSKAIDNVSAEDIKKSPKKYIEKFESVQKEAKAFLNNLKSILGEDFDKEDILAPMEEVIQKHIDNLRKKLKEKK